MQLDFTQWPLLKWRRDDGADGGERTAVDTVTAQTLTNKTLTSPTLTTPVINAPQGLDAIEVLTAARPLVAADSGKTFFLDLATGFACTLPAVATSAGVSYSFIVKTAASGGTYTIVCAGAPDQHIHGAQYSSTGGNGDSTVGDAATTITLADGQAVPGDRVDIVCDGAIWYARVFTNSDTGATFTG